MSSWTGEMPTLLPVTQLQSPREQTQGSDGSLLWWTGMCPGVGKGPGAQAEARSWGDREAASQCQHWREGFHLGKGGWHACRRVSHVGKRLLRGLQGRFAQPPVRSRRKRRGWGIAPQRCPGAAEAPRPLSRHHCREMCGGAEATPGLFTASTKPLYGSPQSKDLPGI